MGDGTDPHHAAEFIVNSPITAILTQLENEMDAAGLNLQLEIAEDTYAFIAAHDPADVDTLSTATFYVDTPLETIQEAAPDSAFAQLETDDDLDAYELVAPDATLRFKFDQQHKTARPLPLNLDQVTIAVPTHEAYLSHSLQEFDAADNE